MSLTVNSLGQNLAMDGRINTNVDVVKHVTTGYTPPENVNEEAASVAEDFADIDYQVSQLQKISDQMGRKLQFNVNKELNKVIVKVVDPSTDQVIKEIPSPDIQKLQLRLKEVLGLLVDKKI